jgi:hypothetical protein
MRSLTWAHGRNAHHAKLLRDSGNRIDIQLRGLDGPVVVIIQVADDRCQHAAGTAPVGIEVNENRSI